MLLAKSRTERNGDYEINNETTDAQPALIDVYRAPGDCYAAWDIVYLEADGTASRLPDARYGVDQPDYPSDEVRWEQASYQMVSEEYRRWDRNGHTCSSTAIYADGRCVASRGD